MIGMTAEVQKKHPFRLVWITWTHCSSVIRGSKESRVMPALLTRMSR